MDFNLTEEQRLVVDVPKVVQLRSLRCQNSAKCIGGFLKRRALKGLAPALICYTHLAKEIGHVQHRFRQAYFGQDG